MTQKEQEKEKALYQELHDLGYKRRSRNRDNRVSAIIKELSKTHGNKSYGRKK